ncbi:DNA methyltransferase [Sulfurimonas crateris]|uniref:DNA methyltransferase n=1 Tax=Sulfurimonas crateris TaxID=2574727 RepID=A0A4U2Z2X7_9BACT|nr:adenine-specific methyltransferase EcoRI family protein [Sulfurimonas crateris]TKI68448.1 DNA methyltransferase [Sulfurimonas crateris]
MANENLANAKKAKNDEFYTQYIDIEKEVSAYLEYDPDVFKNKIILLPCDDPEWSNFTKYFAQNFERFGLKKLISTSYASASKLYDTNYQPTLFEINNPKYDEFKTIKNGKIFTLDHDTTHDGRIDINDLEWHYLEGDGDFRSDEIKKLRDEADIIITNPPFSQFRIFLAWIIASSKRFLIIGNINAITYKEVFPLIKDNKVWLGPSITSGDREFEVPKDVVDMTKFTGKIRDGRYYQRVVGVRWFTNIDHGRRHQPISLMSEKDVIKYSTKKPFDRYDNYDAIEVPYVKLIPNDFDGVMGVPISFLDKYSPEQFEILGSDYEVKDGKLPQLVNSSWQGKLDRGYITGRRAYSRILIKHKR